MTAQPKFQEQPPTITEQEYWDFEETSEAKHEFINGYLWEMSGGTFNHTTICNNLAFVAKSLLRGKPCLSRTSEQKVKSEKSGNTFYPDAVIFCPPARFEGKGDHTLLTPTVIFEVLSPRTEAFDRTGKFAFYRQIETLTDYVLIEAERIYVEHFHRTPDSWLWSAYSRREENLSFPDLELELPLAEIYDELDLPDTLFLVQAPEMRHDEED